MDQEEALKRLSASGHEIGIAVMGHDGLTRLEVDGRLLTLEQMRTLIHVDEGKGIVGVDRGVV